MRLNSHRRMTMAKIIEKTLETIVIATGVSTIFRNTWNEYKETKKALARSERLLKQYDDERKARK